MECSTITDYVKMSPNITSPRNSKIHYITIHCMGSEHTVEELGSIFLNPSKQASSNYGIDKGGRVGLYVSETDRAWTTGGLDKKGLPIRVNGISGADNDQMAITIEVACEREKPHVVSDVALKKTIKLCADICRRYNKNKLVWIPDKEKAMSYRPKKNEMQLTVHRWFSEKECPGDYLFNKHFYICKLVNQILKS